MSNPCAKIIVNPTAGSKTTFREWPHIQGLLRHHGFGFDYQYTEGTGHAIEIAHTAITDGYRFVVAVGGDGTINEVANGLLTSVDPKFVTMGIISTGTGNDFIRSMGIPRDYNGACQALVGSRRMLIDAGMVRFRRNGNVEERYFVNSAGVGFDGEVAEAALKVPIRIGRTLPFVLGLLKTLPGYQNKDVVLNVDGRSESRRVLSVIVSNGVYFGGGMKIAPAAVIDDRKLEVITIGDVSKLELLKVFPRVYNGSHVTHPAVRIERASSVKIECPTRIVLQADGEIIGEGPADFQILPAALTVAA